MTSYSSSMVGPGRWALLEVGDELHGVMWTDEADGIGIVPVEGITLEAHARLALGVATCAAQGTPAIGVYTTIARAYDPETEYRGQLEKLAAKLRPSG